VPIRTATRKPLRQPDMVAFDIIDVGSPKKPCGGDRRR
jgi:hypothetical protein